MSRTGLPRPRVAHTGPGAAAHDDRLPLAALRARLNGASPTADWAMNVDGVRGRSLMVPAGAEATFALRTTEALRLSSRVRLLPHDWRDGRGAVRASAAVADDGGNECEIWSGVIRAGDRGRPGGLPLDGVIPANSLALVLRLAPGRSQHRAVARAIWVEPALSAESQPRSADAAATGGTVTPLVPDPAQARFSVLTPVHDPPLHMLREAIASVQAQTYPAWELCLSDDGSRDPAVIAELQRAAASDPRIRLVRNDEPGGISAATNAALGIARAEFIALLDHDDTLAPDALARVAERLALEPDLDMLYSDEDIVADGRQIWVHLKPGWSPDTLRTNGYTCHLGVYRADLVRKIGGFRSAFDGSQDVDMILRLTERTDRIAHIPHILYHWRSHQASTAGADAKPYAYVAARNAIAAHLERVGLDADVGFGPPGLYRVAHRVKESATVDLVLALTSTQGLAEAAASWVAQPHPAWGVALAAPADVLEHAVGTLAGAGVDPARIRTAEIGPGAAAVDGLQAAAAVAQAEHLLLAHGPAIGITHDWLTRLLGYSAQPGVDAAGPIVLAPDGRVLEGGIALPEGHALHLLHGTRTSMDLFFGYGTSVYNVIALSGFAVTRRATFERLGLRSAFRDLALAEYCLRCPGRIVVVPDARLRVTTPDLTVNDLPALRELWRAWAEHHDHDPFYNPAYRTDRGDFEPVRDRG